MVGDSHDTGSVRTGVNFQILGDADEAGEVAALVLNRLLQAVKTIELGAAAGGNGGNVVSACLSDILCCLGSIFVDSDFHIAQRLDEVAALAQSLFVGDNFLDIRELGALCCHKAVVNLHADRADNAEIVAHHQVVDLVDRACGAVFNGQHAILAEALFNSGENCIKVLEEHDIGSGEQLLASHLRVCSLNTLAGNGCKLGEEIVGVLHSVSDFYAQFLLAADDLFLINLAQIHHQGVERIGVASHVLAGHFSYLTQLLSLALGVKDLFAAVFLAEGNVLADLHALGEEIHNVLVNFVYLYSKFIQFHFICPTFRFQELHHKLQQQLQLPHRVLLWALCKGHACP